MIPYTFLKYSIDLMKDTMKPENQKHVANISIQLEKWKYSLTL